MASPNTAILKEILAKIEGLGASVSSLRNDVNSLRNDVNDLKKDMSGVKKELADLKHEFNAYTKREGRTQESIDVKRFFRAWNEYSIIPAYKSQFREFYRSSENSLLTDLDGCVFIGDPAEIAYIIESKHALDVDQLLKKLGQFCEILDTLRLLQSNDGPTWLKNQSSKFREMVATHNLLHFPKDIYFIFASDSISNDMQEYIQKINKGERRRNEMQKISLFRESEIYNYIQESDKIPAWIKEQLAKAGSVHAITKIINNPKSELHDIKDKISALFPDTDPCFEQLQGRLGILCLDQLVWPTGDTALPGLRRGGRRKTKRRY
jgi:uncharacterized coiled-coil DUF342 family protein